MNGQGKPQWQTLVFICSWHPLLSTVFVSFVFHLITLKILRDFLAANFSWDHNVNSKIIFLSVKT